jgi:hypothetical protein
MGFLSFFKKIFVGKSEAEEAEPDAARARHGITVDKREMDKETTEAERFAEEYDAWKDIKEMRMSFFTGRWAVRKFRVMGEDKVKKRLAELEEKRKEEAEEKRRGGE